jgi:hypothetical protein
VTRQNHNTGLLAYWPQLIGMISLVFGAGVVYGKFGTMDEKQRAMELRQDRHLEMMQAQEKRIIELEKRTEYYRGLREGRQEVTQKNNSQ